MNELTAKQALVDFELKLKAALGRAQAAYEKRNEEDSYGEALDWGHEFGLNIATKLLQNYKEALGKVAPKEPTATIEMTAIAVMVVEEETPDLQSFQQFMTALEQSGLTFVDSTELTAIIAEKARLLECLRDAQKGKQALTDLLNALAAFELLLEEALAAARRDYENTGPEMSYSEGLDWGHKWGLELAMNRWQDCKEAIAKIGGKS